MGKHGLETPAEMLVAGSHCRKDNRKQGAWPQRVPWLPGSVVKENSKLYFSAICTVVA